MTRHLALAAILLVALGSPGRAQDQRPAGSPTAAPPTLRIQVVVSRYQGEKKVSSLPYTLTVHADTERDRRVFGTASLRLGTQVPISTTVYDKDGKPSPSVQYRDVGTNIDCTISVLEQGAFKASLTVEDSSMDTGPASGQNPQHPTFRSFKTSDSLVLRDGQSGQFSTATDKVSGDVWKVDVTLNVVK